MVPPKNIRTPQSRSTIVPSTRMRLVLIPRSPQRFHALETIRFETGLTPVSWPNTSIFSFVVSRIASIRAAQEKPNIRFFFRFLHRFLAEGITRIFLALFRNLERLGGIRMTQVGVKTPRYGVKKGKRSRANVFCRAPSCSWPSGGQEGSILKSGGRILGRA